MRKQNIKIACFLFFLILFIQANCFSLSAQTQEESLYKRLGGVYNIAAVIDDFVDRLLSDPTITANKNVVSSLGKITKPGLKYQLTELLCQAAGGPQKYNGRSMKESHQGLNITETEWQAMVKDFLATLAKFNIKDLEQNELLVIVGGTKSDIVVSAPQGAQPQVPVLPGTVPVNPAQPLPQLAPNLPSAIPTLPNPANVPSAAPALPTLPSPANIPSAVPAIPTLPNPANIPSVVPALPTLPSLPDNVVPSKPTTKPSLPAVPVITPPSIDLVRPRLEIPSNSSGNIAPQIQPQAETAPKNDTPQDAAVTDIEDEEDELPPEPTLEPAN